VHISREEGVDCPPPLNAMLWHLAVTPLPIEKKGTGGEDWEGKCPTAKGRENRHPQKTRPNFARGRFLREGGESSQN